MHHKPTVSFVLLSFLCLFLFLTIEETHSSLPKESMNCTHIHTLKHIFKGKIEACVCVCVSCKGIFQGSSMWVCLYDTRSGPEPQDFISLPRAASPLLTFESLTNTNTHTHYPLHTHTHTTSYTHTHTHLELLWQLQAPFPWNTHSHHTAVPFLLTSRNPGRHNPRTVWVCVYICVCVCLQGFLGATTHSSSPPAHWHAKTSRQGQPRSQNTSEERGEARRHCAFLSQRNMIPTHWTINRNYFSLKPGMSSSIT